jgi:small subunit ribosomal protein S5
MANGPKGSFEESPFVEEVVKVYRCATVVRGGRRFSFSALVVVGDHHGQVGWGYGKAKEVPMAVDKGIKEARKVLTRVNLNKGTIPHQVVGVFGASRVVMVPAAPGTGVIAGASVRAVMELAGVHDVLTKSYGSNSPKNLVKAVFNAFDQLRTRKIVEDLRGVKLSKPMSA